MAGTPRTLRVFAPAKINWYLAVERRRPDGYHDIVTVFQALDWGDELRCSPRRDRRCRIECTDPAVPTDASNLIARAWERLARSWPGRVGGLDVRLIKRIPVGGGLGGGSSDAAAALWALRRLYRLPLDVAALEREAAALGSDCAFFIRGGAALGCGRGERLQPLVSRLPRSTALVLVWPGFPISTAQAYGAIKPEHYRPGLMGAEVVAEALRRGDVQALAAAIANVFDRAVLEADARFHPLVERMRAAGLQGPMLAGSGATVFGIARDGRHARRAAQALAAHYPVVRVAHPRKWGVRALPESYR